MDTKEIYFAGGCFWGVEHFFKGVSGVTATLPGYANGRFANPTYEQVYKDDTGFAETVRVTYRPDVVGLDMLCRLFFMIIDPLSLNRQGEDVGTRYRTGVYYSSEADRPVLEAAFAAETGRIGCKPVTELLPLQCFYGAEEYHQKYLDKNPGGYCHLSLKTFAYLKVFEKVRMYLGAGESHGNSADEAAASLGEPHGNAADYGEPDPIARMAEIAAIVHEGMHFFWTGFYRVMPKPGTASGAGASADALDAAPENCQLVLGPFQGPPACLRIAYGRGVCGTAWKERRTIVVPDVEQFPGHIACSSASRSEIVVPVFAPAIDSHESDAGDSAFSEGTSSRREPVHGRRASSDNCSQRSAVTAVLDIDSDRLATFDTEDARWLELIVSML